MQDSELEHEKMQKEELLQLTDTAAKYHEADSKSYFHCLVFLK